MGPQELVGLVRQGLIRPKHLWTAMKGAAKYRAALALPGRQRAAEDAQACANVCLQCKARTTTTTECIKRYGIVELSFCGKPLEESATGPDGGGPTCGCLVGARCLGGDPDQMKQVWHEDSDAIEAHYTSGGLMAAGKCLVKGEQCPRGKWPEARVTYGE